MKKLLLILLCFCVISSCNKRKNISQNEFLNKVENNEVKSITFLNSSGYAEVELLNNPGQFMYLKDSDILEIKKNIHKYYRQHNIEPVEINHRVDTKNNSLFRIFSSEFLKVSALIFGGFILSFIISRKIEKAGQELNNKNLEVVGTIMKILVIIFLIIALNLF